MTDAKRPASPPTPAERSAAALEGLEELAGRIAAALERLSPPPPMPVDLDGQYGDPKVFFDPRDWKGPSMKGRTFSRTSADFLEALAPVLDYFASTATERKERRGKLLDAARARGWAERLRAGWSRGGGASASLGSTSMPRAAFPTAAPLVPKTSSSAYPTTWDEVPEEPELEELD